VTSGDKPQKYFCGCRENRFCFATSSMESIDATQMPHIMVDFRFRRSRWQIKVEAVHFRLEHASSSESSAIRAEADVPGHQAHHRYTGPEKGHGQGCAGHPAALADGYNHGCLYAGTSRRGPGDGQLNPQGAENRYRWKRGGGNLPVYTEHGKASVCGAGVGDSGRRDACNQKRIEIWKTDKALQKGEMGRIENLPRRRF